VQGLYKGSMYKTSWSSPLVYLWRKPGGPGGEDEIMAERPERWAGWKREPVWEVMGIKAWVEALPESILAESFPRTEPIFLNQELIDAFLRQTVFRERVIRQAMTEPCDMDAVFPQCFGQCEGAYGSPCEYVDACWLPHIGEDPLRSGLYRERQFHHEGEAKAFLMEE
jgi:hypothetical protein